MFLGGLMENKYPVYHWRVKSHWLSGTTSFDDVYIALPDLELARDFIQAHVRLHYATSDIRVATSVSLMNIIPQVETLPAAYRLESEAVWGEQDVLDMYPTIRNYWVSKGFTDIRIMPCRPVDEDCLYLDGKWHSYCRHAHEWMQPEDLCAELKPRPAKQRRRKYTV